ncbi:hypothetical protein GCM10023196_085360 [Actinoallomurus vinaceus]|uniref:Uncharacterized protein n=1 Tax=Actinoallomurus vinaceus TaxID=1080074 RepID=A0ABP8UNV6_9ACTN
MAQQPNRTHRRPPHREPWADPAYREVWPTDGPAAETDLLPHATPRDVGRPRAPRGDPLMARQPKRTRSRTPHHETWADPAHREVIR